MRKVFADAGYLIAVINPRDELHSKATEVGKSLEPCRIVTSEFVLLEVMKVLIRSGRKRLAYDAVMGLRQNPNTEIVPATSSLFREACRIYIQHSDKDWDAIDSSSYWIMKTKGIVDVLTYDHHFQQMGFRALLRND